MLDMRKEKWVKSAAAVSTAEKQTPTSRMQATAHPSSMIPAVGCKLGVLPSRVRQDGPHYFFRNLNRKSAG
jgi:hypothetical protein